jgi:hypothetical protein
MTAGRLCTACCRLLRKIHHTMAAIQLNMATLEQGLAQFLATPLDT